MTVAAERAASALERYEAVIGIEIHCQLRTVSKMFCSCSTQYDGAPPNTHCCPVCLGLPGALPVMNRAAVEFVIATGLAIEATIPERTQWERKNYFYPDLPKGSVPRGRSETFASTRIWPRSMSASDTPIARSTSWSSSA